MFNQSQLNFDLENFLNVDRIAEIPIALYIHYGRKAVLLSVEHFGRVFHYYLGRRRRRTCYLFFFCPDLCRAWSVCCFLTSSAVIAEDLVNIYINRIADMLEYEDKANNFSQLPQG